MKNGTQSKIGPRMKKKMKKRKKVREKKRAQNSLIGINEIFFFLVKFDIYNEEGEILIQGALNKTLKNVS